MEKVLIWENLKNCLFRHIGAKSNLGNYEILITSREVKSIFESNDGIFSKIEIETTGSLDEDIELFKEACEKHNGEDSDT